MRDGESNGGRDPYYGDEESCMTHQHESSPVGETNLGPGIAPTFGDVPGSPFEHTPERIVLSSDEHTKLSARALAALGGEFTHEQLGRGLLSLRETDQPGQVHVEARVSKHGRPLLQIEADVRESWLSRAASAGEDESPSVLIVQELVRLAELPMQSTVRLRSGD